MVVGWVACQPGGIDRQLLLDQSSPILMYDDVVLFEDFIHDHGVVRMSVKTRIMPRCWFVLLRYWLRVDGVVMKVCPHVWESSSASYVPGTFFVFCYAAPKKWQNICHNASPALLGRSSTRAAFTSLESPACFESAHSILRRSRRCNNVGCRRTHQSTRMPSQLYLSSNFHQVNVVNNIVWSTILCGCVQYFPVTIGVVRLHALYCRRVRPTPDLLRISIQTPPRSIFPFRFVGPLHEMATLPKDQAESG